MESRPNLIAIVGPTASGKTALALDIAQRWNGEIICADSRTIYKGMDIGTAKPTAEEQARIRHWGVDLVEPGQVFTAADFKRYANEAIADIRSRGKLPILVGGTGLYIDSVLYDYTFAPVKDKERRAELEGLTLEELHDHCTKNNIPLPQNERNKRHLIHAIERQDDTPSTRSPLQHGAYIVGIATSMQLLRTRISGRAEHLFANDVEREATLLGKKYGWDSEAMTGNIYPLIKSYNAGLLTKAEVEEKFTTADYRLAKRQMTWFRRNPDIMWATLSGAETYLRSLLAAE